VKISVKTHNSDICSILAYVLRAYEKEYITILVLVEVRDKVIPVQAVEALKSARG
jgi:hypothetical protein